MIKLISLPYNGYILTPQITQDFQLVSMPSNTVLYSQVGNKMNGVMRFVSIPNETINLVIPLTSNT